MVDDVNRSRRSTGAAGIAMNDHEVMTRMADLVDELTLPAWQRQELEVTIKPDGSPVTDIDVAVETELRALVAAAQPHDGFVGEEVGEQPGAPTPAGSGPGSSALIGRPIWP
jgi:histidinol-phosphatase